MAWVSQTDASASVPTQSAQSWAEFFQALEVRLGDSGIFYFEF
jgi:hypothetical protein